jgi:hypothetical protein
MQHEQVSLDQGTPLLRTDGLVLISNTVKGPRHVMYPFRTCYSVLTYSLVHPSRPRRLCLTTNTSRYCHRRVARSCLQR